MGTANHIRFEWYDEDVLTAESRCRSKGNQSNWEKAFTESHGNNIMNRRQVLLGSSAVLIPITGCLGFRGSDPPTYDCSRSARPEPESRENPDAVMPAAYPDPPATSRSDVEMERFVERFEEAYRHNQLVQSEGNDLRRFGFDSDGTWTVDSPKEGGVVGIEYQYFYEMEGDSRNIVVDSPTQTAVYYVDESVAIRAHTEGLRTKGTELDPREHGRVVACFE